MLTVTFYYDQEGMTVPYEPLVDELRSNRGFSDLRGRPDLAINIAETLRSPALRALIGGLAQSGSAFHTLGCDLGAHEEPWRGETLQQVAGGYVQIISADYDGRSPEDYTALGQFLAHSLEEEARNQDWSLKFVVQPVVLALDDYSGLVVSLHVWFFAAAATMEAAHQSRDALIAALHRALIKDHAALVVTDGHGD